MAFSLKRAFSAKRRDVIRIEHRSCHFFFPNFATCLECIYLIFEDTRYTFFKPFIRNSRSLRSPSIKNLHSWECVEMFDKIFRSVYEIRSNGPTLSAIQGPKKGGGGRRNIFGGSHMTRRPEVWKYLLAVNKCMSTRFHLFSCFKTALQVTIFSGENKEKILDGAIEWYFSNTQSIHCHFLSTRSKSDPNSNTNILCHCFILWGSFSSLFLIFEKATVKQ